MKRILLALMLILAPSMAFAQARVVSTCGDLSGVGGNYPAGALAQLTQSSTGLLCSSGGSSGGSTDPCAGTKTNLPISSAATASTQIIAASGSNKIYICSLALIAAGATSYNLTTGTGANCGTSTAAVLGSLTAANGLSFAANGGLTLGSGVATIASGIASGALCTLQSNAVYVSGNLTYVQAP